MTAYESKSSSSNIPFLVSLCSTGNRACDLVSFLDGAAKLGFDGVELWDEHLRTYLNNGGNLASVAANLSARGLRVTTIASRAEVIEPAAADAAVALAAELSEWAAEIGRPGVRMFVDWVASEEASEEQWERAVAGVRRMADAASPHGVIILLETHHGQLTDTTKTTLEMIRQVDRDNVRVILDIYNLFHMGEEPLEALPLLYPYTVNVHLKNGSHSPEGKVSYGKLLTEGDMAVEPFLHALWAIGYRGFTAVEWFGDDYWGSAAKELAYLRGFS
ncbi:sugar phosphate isomerase/epimerase family protein [Paenibacillus oryzisoli]|uniref:sugar phosphate isomerase/epimerase family protein n=1 Tax=Paenibacillus oryzisoli TaxID=1850517 RepID=UPI003D2C2B41